MHMLKYGGGGYWIEISDNVICNEDYIGGFEELPLNNKGLADFDN